MGTVDVDVPPTTSWSWNCSAADELGASDADGATDAVDGSADPTDPLPSDGSTDAAAELEAEGDSLDGAGADAPGPVAQSPANSTAGIGVEVSPPTTPMTIVVCPLESDRIAPPVSVLPPWAWNWTKACGRVDGSATLGNAGTLGSGVVAA